MLSKNTPSKQCLQGHKVRFTKLVFFDILSFIATVHSIFITVLHAMFVLNTVSLGFCVGRFSCNFGPADHSHIYVNDLKGLLMAEQLKRQKRIATVL